MSDTQTPRENLIEALEDTISKAERGMREAVQTHDQAWFRAAAQGFRLTQETWLRVTQHMSPEQAHAAVLDFALTEKLSQWIQKGLQGPAPSILSLYP
jgi:hypothetical protein